MTSKKDNRLQLYVTDEQKLLIQRMNFNGSLSEMVRVLLMKHLKEECPSTFKPVSITVGDKQFSGWVYEEDKTEQEGTGT